MAKNSRDKRMMPVGRKYEFKVDGLIYELRLSEEINLALDGGANPVYAPEYDPFDWWATPVVTYDIFVTRYPMRVYRQVLIGVRDWMGGTRPQFFTITANSEKKARVCEIVARRLAKQFGYAIEVVGPGFTATDAATVEETSRWIPREYVTFRMRKLGRGEVPY